MDTHLLSSELYLLTHIHHVFLSLLYYTEELNKLCVDNVHHCSRLPAFLRSIEAARTGTLRYSDGFYLNEHLPDVAAALLLLVIVYHLATDNLHPRMELKEKKYLSFSSQIQSD